jgi:hypothetical protein
MTRRSFVRSTRGGVVLDLVIAVGLILLATFVLTAVGVTWSDLVNGFVRFFGW